MDERKVSKEKIETYTNINSFEYMECSAKSGENVSNLFQVLGNKLYQNYLNTTSLQNKPIEIANILKKDNKNKCC